MKMDKPLEIMVSKIYREMNSGNDIAISSLQSAALTFHNTSHTQVALIGRGFLLSWKHWSPDLSKRNQLIVDFLTKYTIYYDIY